MNIWISQSRKDANEPQRFSPSRLRALARQDSFSEAGGLAVNREKRSSAINFFRGLGDHFFGLPSPLPLKGDEDSCETISTHIST